MLIWNPSKLTANGKALLAKVQAGKCAIQITKAQSGNGTYTSDEDISSQTALKSVKQTFPISSKVINSSSALVLKITMENSDLTTGYEITEFGVFADDPDKGEILYSIATAQTSDYMPAYNGVVPSVINMSYYLEVANADDVTIQSAGALALQGDLQVLADCVAAIESDIADMVVKETIHATLSSDWFVIEDKEDYNLVAVYSHRNDSVNYVQGVQRRNNGGYSVLINGGMSGMEMDFYTVWIKNVTGAGGSQGGNTGGNNPGSSTGGAVVANGKTIIKTERIALSYASSTLLRGHAQFDGKVLSAVACIEDQESTPVLQTDNVYTDVGIYEVENRVEVYAKGENYVQGHSLAVNVIAVLEGAGEGNIPGAGGDCNCTEVTLPTSDKTLTEDGGYADAAATGEAIGKINDEIFSNVSQSNLVGSKTNAIRYHGSADFRGFMSYVELKEDITISGLTLPIKPYSSTAVDEVTIMICRNDEEIIHKTYDNLNIRDETEYKLHFDDVDLKEGDILGYGFLCPQPIGFYNSSEPPSITSKYILNDNEIWEDFLPELATDRIYASFFNGRNKITVLEKEIETLKNKVSVKNVSRWYGKTGNIIGDSITAMGLYTQKLTEKAGIIVNNYGVGGTTYSSINSSNPFYERVSDMTEECDFVLAFGGTNDWGLSVPIGNPNDTEPNTFYGGLNATFSALRAKFPTKPIFVGTILQRDLASGKGQATGMMSNGNGDSVADFNEAIKRVAERYGCKIINGYSESGIIYENLDIYMSDGLHLNDRGAERYAQFVLDKMEQVTPY